MAHVWTARAREDRIAGDYSHQHCRPGCYPRDFVQIKHQAHRDTVSPVLDSAGCTDLLASNGYEMTPNLPAARGHWLGSQKCQRLSPLAIVPTLNSTTEDPMVSPSRMPNCAARFTSPHECPAEENSWNRLGVIRPDPVLGYR